MPEPMRSFSFRRLSLVAFALLGAALLAPSAASAASVVGAVYTQSNDVTDNQVIAFNRLSDGTLSFSQSVSTGGTGQGSRAFGCAPSPADTCPITDSQGSVAITPAGGLVFVTNAGSDTISAFRVSPTRGLTLVAQVGSGGDYPQSLTLHGNVLYVLNEDSANIDGFKFTTAGRLTEIPGTNQPLISDPGIVLTGPLSGFIGPFAAEVGFSHTGSTLVVTERGTGIIDTFPVKSGRAGPAIANTSSEPTPFGFAFDAYNHALVTDAFDGVSNGFVSSYSVSSKSILTPLTVGESTDGVAPCWVVVTPDSRHAYVTNTVTKTIAEYSVSPTGVLRLLGTVDVPDTENGPAQFPTDIAISRDGRFVYTIVPSVFDTDNSFISGFRVGLTGRLTFLTETEQNLPIGLSGLVAR